jgi:hypothetical protein
MRLGRPVITTRRPPLRPVILARHFGGTITWHGAVKIRSSLPGNLGEIGRGGTGTCVVTVTPVPRNSGERLAEAQHIGLVAK